MILDDTPVKIKEVPEKEGLLFKHINYIITHNLVLGKGGLSGHKKLSGGILTLHGMSLKKIYFLRFPFTNHLCLGCWSICYKSIHLE